MKYMKRLGCAAGVSVSRKWIDHALLERVDSKQRKTQKL